MTQSMPSLSANPSIPNGYRLMSQPEVTSEMTTWAVALLHDTSVSMFATAKKTFGAVSVLARIQWHPPDFQNSTIHRGVTLFEPLLQAIPVAFNLNTVMGIQRALNYLMPARTPLVEDGVLGSATAAAVRAFQESASLAVDGIVGPDTLAALRAKLQASGPSTASSVSNHIDAIVDLSHHNPSVDFAAAATLVSAVIHKATQGTSFTDPTYVDRRGRAESAGLLWGAYHFGDGSDGVAQAKFFLSKVEPADLLVLDLEANRTGPSMSLSEAQAFVQTVFQTTGRYPGLYGGSYIKELLGSNIDPVLANCWLWLAQYGSRPIVPPTWSDWTIWQYTDGAHGPNPVPVPGIGACDRDMLNADAAGTTPDVAGLRSFWAAQTG